MSAIMKKSDLKEENTMKRFLCTLLALCMAVVLLPAGALAQEQLPQSLSGAWVNPLYEGVVGEDDVAVEYPMTPAETPMFPM